MKRIYYIFLAFTLLLTSCNFLDVEPKSQWSQSEIPTEDAHIQGLLDGGYERLCNALLQGFVIYGDERADVYYINDRTQSSHARINRNELDGNLSRSSWRDLYEAVRQANVVIKFIDGFLAKEGISSTQKNNYNYIKGQAYAMRAFSYYWIVRIWGEAPILNEAVTSSEFVFAVAKSPVAKIFKQIDEDLDVAISTIPAQTTSTNTQRHRFNQVSARALKAHLYMWRASFEDVAYYDQALALLDNTNLIPAANSTLYNLVPLFDATQTAGENTAFRSFVDATQYSQMFNAPTRLTGIESVFELAFNAADGDVNNAFDGFWVSSSVTTFKVREELYNNLYDDSDFRRFAAISAPGSSGKMNARKWVVNYKRGDSRNLVLIRLADLILLRAESRIKPLTEDMPTEVDAILADINRIRQRAMGPDGVITSADVAGYTKEDWNMLIKAERQRELIFEGQRWFDLMRWGDAQRVMAAMPPSSITPPYPYPTGPINISNNPNALYWPVSNEEIRRSALILQNEYYK